MLKDLRQTFERIADQSHIPAKFCFFIDGLDEYSGEEEEVVKILSFLFNWPHVKLCVSSRPRPVLEEKFVHSSHTLTVQDFTREDMKTYVRQRLQSNEKFKRLQASDPSSETIIKQIAAQAQGVWLWVFLVTRELVHAVNRNEGLPMLRKILHQFPPDLEAYFQHIIEGIKPSFREEMAQIFLITIKEVQPLPLFAFSLLERESKSSDYAVEAPIAPVSAEELSETYSTWKMRIQNRCGDLLMVDDRPHPALDAGDSKPALLSHPVDFLHRTVRDFLQDCYYKKLEEALVSPFDPLASLCKMTLFLLKGLPDARTDLRQKASINGIVGLVDELLYYTHELEKGDRSLEPSLNGILDEVNRVNCHYATRSIRNHWTHARDSPPARGHDEYREGGKCNFLALAVQARLVKYVRAKIQSDPRRAQKAGRPLLDYALRPRRVTAISMPYHSEREDPSVDVEMVQLLLEYGASPNQQVHLNDGRTVWALFLLSCHESTNRDEASMALKNAWYQASELLIRHGAKMECWFDNDDRPLTVPQILARIFGEEKALRLRRLMEEAQTQRVSGSWWSWPPTVATLVRGMPMFGRPSS
ncbi:hypothetical protein CDD83_10290 [Cordyceps sp. RAO-2017]|nr:hypothetical protein CDD83_10290 [Cordyceps sp. RAO-2017]